MDEKELLKLIKQLSESERIYNEKEGYYTNEGSPSWKARRKAEQLTDTSVIPFLNNLLEKSKDRETRENIYFILGKIGENTEDERVVDILLKCLEIETNKSALESILMRVAEQKNVKDCSTILKFVEDERAAIRHEAILALRGCKSSVAEESLLNVIKESTDSYALTYANSVLSDIGTNKSIPHLINLLGHPNVDVKCSAIGALEEIGDTSLLPIFLKALQNRSVAVKGYAMLAIKKHGDETAIVPVIERIKTILKRKRTIESNELIDGLELLIRFEKEYDEIQALFNWIKFKKWDFLFHAEKKWIEENIN